MTDIKNESFAQRFAIHLGYQINKGVPHETEFRTRQVAFNDTAAEMIDEIHSMLVTIIDRTSP